MLKVNAVNKSVKSRDSVLTGRRKRKLWDGKQAGAHSTPHDRQMRSQNGGARQGEKARRNQFCIKNTLRIKQKTQEQPV